MKPQLFRKSESPLRAQSQEHGAWRARTESPKTTIRRFAVVAALFVWAVACAAGSYAADAKDSNRLLVKFRNAYDAQVQDVVNSLGARITSEIPAIGVKVVEFPHGTNIDAKLRVLQNHAKVAFAELDEAVPPAAIPNDPFYDREWHLVRIGAPGAWNIATGSTNLIIAILDTGMDGAQPDLAAKLVPGWNFYDNNGDTSDLYSSHGTGVAGAAAATSNNNAGVAAPAWNCKLMPCRITDPSNIALASTTAKALIWAADHGARVANISFQFTANSTVSAAAQYFQSHGGVVTMSAGNNGAFNPLTDNPYILSISATDANDVLASWSNTGNYMDLAAPGVDIYTTVKGGGYGPGSGTSYSAPIVAGVAALVLSVNPALSGQQVRDILFDSAMDIGPAGWDPKYGWGRIDAFAAVQLASGNPPPSDLLPPQITSVVPSNGTTVSGLTTVQVTATDNVAIASVSFSVDGILQAVDTTAPYDFNWNTANVSNGTHTLLIAATDTSRNTAQEPVSVTVSNLADTTPPTVAITSPKNGTRVKGTVAVTVAVNDTVGVVRVELHVDGVMTKASTTAPFTIKWSTSTAARGTHTLQSRAFDLAGNNAWSTAITVHK